MLEIKIDGKEAERIYLEKLEKRMKELDNRLTLWDTKELIRQTNMSWSTIQSMFFFHPEFPKHKKGQKWYFPAEETREFLLKWLKGEI